MTEHLVIRNLQQVFTGELRYPTLTRYNRLEARPRTNNFTRALHAEVRDPLWLLCKQWQMGEFLGDDAGTPVYAKIHVEGQRITKYQPAGASVQKFAHDTPLEATVERRAFPFAVGTQKMSLDLRLLMGRRWLKMIPAATAPLFKDAYPIEPPNPASKADAAICAHPEVWQQWKAVAGRAMDGAQLYFHLKTPGNVASDDIAGLSVADKSSIDAAGVEFVRWFEALYFHPSETSDAWQPERLEYQFDCAVPDGQGGEKVLNAEEYYHERLDWYNFDWEKGKTLDEPAEAAPEAPVEARYTTQSFIPAPVRFDGMPDTRWWAFEDGKTNFGDIKPGTTDLAKLLFIEFGLVYANDWFVLPYTVPTGSVLNIRGLAVTNTFGERYWIEPAGRGSDEAWQRWNMFSLNIKGEKEEPADLTLLVLPTVPKIQEGQPMEEVALIRDEMANMVWGIETAVPLAHGRTKPGNIAAAEFHDFLQGLIPTAVPVAKPAWKAPFRYDIMTSVPENWIPFVPEHIPGSNRRIQLRRAAMPRFLENENPPIFERVRPRTVLLREGLDQGTPYHIHEEEVPRAGVHVLQAFQRTRWTNGKVFTWLGVKKRTGRGEGHSGLAFDRLVPAD
ncbi:MAG: hypothetical protein KF734_16860 [Saprospiraceae bacterium]|nr:hypothetical protein [Saprospiraceae bacterium]